METTPANESLRLELEAVKRAYWHSQIQLSQLLIERSLRDEAVMRQAADYKADRLAENQ